jgi:hypothetical protein
MASAIPYELRGSIAKPTGATVVLAMEFPSRVMIHKVMVRQQAGSASFTLNVYNFNPANFAAANPEELFRVFPVQTGSGGVLNYFPVTPFPFFNHDGTAGIDAVGRNSPKLYLSIAGAATGTMLVLVSSLNPLT